MEALAQTLTTATADRDVVPPNLIDDASENITPEMLTLVELNKEQINELVATTPGGVRNVKDIYPLAPLQQGILFHHLMNDKNGDNYVLPMLFSVASRERLTQFIGALQRVVDRHDVLRTAIIWEQVAQPLQIVSRWVALPVEEVTLGENVQDELAQWLLPERQRMEIRRAPLARLRVAANPKGDDWFVLLQLHHLIFDHGSLDLMLAEVKWILESPEESLPDPVPYRNHVAQCLTNARRHDAQSYFRAKLGDIEEPVAPFGLLDVLRDGSGTEEARRFLERNFSRRLRALARKRGVSPATLFHAGWALVVAATSGSADVVFGSVLLGRLHGDAGAKQVLGLFINTLPVRLRLEGLTAHELIEQTYGELVGLLSYEQASLAEAQRCSGISGAAPLFTSLLNYLHGTPNRAPEQANMAAGVRMMASPEWTNYPITVSVEDQGEDFAVTVVADRRIGAERITTYLRSVMGSLADALEGATETPALKLSIISDAERYRLMKMFNSSQKFYEWRGLVHQMVEEQVEAAPDAVALIYENQPITYLEINRRANQLARYLNSLGIGTGQLVGLCLNRTPEMIVSVLGVLKSGAAYLPLDPTYPAARLDYMLADAKPEVVLTQTDLRSRLSAPSLKIISLSEVSADVHEYADVNELAPATGPTMESLVYVIYTSGSTGLPKGIEMPHRSMVNLINWHRETFGQAEKVRVLQFAALSFDVAFQEIFSTLCTGGTLVLLDEWVRRDARSLAHFLRDQRIERLFIPPLMLQSLAECCLGMKSCPDSLADIITAGEQLRVSPEIVALFERLKTTRLHNHYGPTESHVVTALTLSGDPHTWPAIPTVGRPISNSQIYVLDRQLQLVPLGIQGEIYIGGVGVARGYRGRNKLTAERFVSSPFDVSTHIPLYKTGDLGRWTPDGELEFLGRNDNQVKIRGYRIELGEVESLVVRYPAVKEAVVLAREHTPGDRRLVAYLIPQHDKVVDIGELRTFLRASIPEYMIPSAFVTLGCFPLTPNGKLDRRGLPEPALGAFSTRPYEPPIGSTEQLVAEIWRDLLQIGRIGREDNYFELGGHSLLMVPILERLRRAGFASNVRSIYENPTVRALSTVISRESGADTATSPNLIPEVCEKIESEMLTLIALDPSEIERIANSVPGGMRNIQDIYPLAPLQEGILFHHLLSENRADPYVLPTLLSFTSPQKLTQFMHAFQKVVDRHDVLRSSVLWEDLPKPLQVVYRQVELKLESLDIDWTIDPIEQLKERMASECHRLDIRKAPLLRLRSALSPDGATSFVLMQMHHIICDHESLATMLSEIVAFLEDRTNELPDPVPYRYHVAQSLEQERKHDAEIFFRAKLEGIESSTAPFDLLDVRADGTRVQQVQAIIDLDTARRLRQHARNMGVTSATLFHAAWGLVVAKTSARDDVVFGSVLLGRLQGTAGSKRILGMFINTLPLRLRLNGMPTRDFVMHTHNQLVDLLSHEQASLAVAQRCSGIVGSAPLFTSLFNYRHSSNDIAVGTEMTAGVKLIAEADRTNYPITISIDDLGEGFRLTAQTDLRIDPAHIAGYLSVAINSILHALESRPETEVMTLSILPLADFRQILESFNSADEFNSDELIHGLFERHASKTPNAIAISYDGMGYTYDQLNRRANQLGRYLLDLGVSTGELVGVCVDRTVDLVVSLLAVLKAGAAYVPLDPNYPSERLHYMLLDSAPRVVITTDQLGNKLSASIVQALSLDGDKGKISQRKTTNITNVQFESSRQLAYVIYTSGSTGEPKGVMVEHRNVIRLFRATDKWFDFSSSDVWSLFHSFAFDFSVWEMWGALIYGGRLVVVPHIISRSPSDFFSLICREKVTVLNQTPSAFSQFINAQSSSSEEQHSLRLVIFGGEALELSMLRPWVARNGDETPRLVNMYGITETTVHVTYRLLSKVDIECESSSLIGRPISDLRTYLLDSYGVPVPIGVVGELYVGGAGVARGYLSRPELTAERFLQDPFSPHPDSRMYRTGDLGRWRSDGDIEYLGRNDHQVKIRGFRIELGEIESQLLRHPLVREAAVIAREDSAGGKRLVGYIVPKNREGAPELRVEELRSHLKEVLPEHMVPSAFVILGAMPLTTNGKLDRRSLPAPEVGAYSSRRYKAPEGEIEEVLAGIWQQVLRVERVGSQDNFFELGGHSLLIVQMMERLRRVGLTTSVRNVFDAPSLAELALLLSRGIVDEIEAPPNLIPVESADITPDMLPLVALSASQIQRVVQAVPGGAPNICDIYPLAPLQEGILFHHLLNRRGGDTYVLPTVLTISSKDRCQELIEALQQTIQNHDALRTAILWEQLPTPVQVVYRKAILPVEEVMLNPEVDSLEQVHEWLRPEFQRIDLRRAPLIRMKIAREPSGERWYALLQIHHIIDDATSLRIVVSEVVDRLAGRASELPEPVPYRNHVAQALTYARRRDAEAFFRSKLSDLSEPTAPFGLVDVHGDGSQTDEAHDELGSSLTGRLRAQARKMGVSAATMMHAAWAMVVSRTSGRDDVAYGTVLMGRLHGSAGAQRIIGMFINTLPLRLRLAGMSAKSLVEQTQRELVELLSHEQASLAVAQRCSGIQASAPVFTSLLNYRHGSKVTEIDWSNASGISVLAGRERTNYPIALMVDDHEVSIALTVQTDQSLDPHRVMQYILGAIESLTHALESELICGVVTLPILPQSELRKLIHEFNATNKPLPYGELIHELFEQRVSLSPNSIAVICEQYSLTYIELNRRANQLARFLRGRGVGPDQLVGLCVERSIEMVVGLLGILKAGGAYLPLDPTYPPDRLTHMINDSLPKLILIQARLRERIPNTAHTHVLALDKEWATISLENCDNLNKSVVGISPSNLAYVIYTSGSTGLPKGAMNEHRAVVNRLHWMQAEYELQDYDRVLQKTPYSFDVSVWEFFWTLMSGARLIMARPEGHKDPVYLTGLIEKAGVTTVHFVPSMLQNFLEQYESGRCQTLQHIVCSGEELSVSLQRRCFESLPRVKLSNLYGPTEAAVDVTSWECQVGNWENRVPIGRPISNSQIYVLTNGDRPVPLGVTAQIYIGGVGVGRGYLNRPEMTASRFVPDPFSKVPGARMYKTGDLGRHRDDGAIEYLGRNDNQVKLRGFRIELGEIESQILSHPKIKDVVVLARQDTSGEKRLVAYITAVSASDCPSVDALRTHIRGVLPEYMVPTAFVALAEFPLTPSGKLNRLALPAPEREDFLSQEYQEPVGELEEILAGIWQEVLNASQVGRHDNFFELGGHSLLIVQMMERLRRVDLTVEVRDVFESSTLSDLAARIRKGRFGETNVPPNLIPPVCKSITPNMLTLLELDQNYIDIVVNSVPGGAANVQDIYPLTPLQEGILFHYLLEDRDDTYLMPTVLSLSSHRRLIELIAAFQSVISRHDVLRTSILWEQLPRPVQVVHRNATLAIEEVVLDDTRSTREQIEEWIRPERQKMDLRRAPLVRLRTAADPQDGKWYVSVQLHHIICDHVAVEDAISEVVAFLEHEATTLPEPSPYRAHVAQVLDQSKRLNASEFFGGKLSDVTETTAPFGLSDVHANRRRLALAYQDVEPSLAVEVRASARRLGVSVATLFHVAWGIVVAKTSDRDDVVYGTVLLGRLQGTAGAGRTLGMFINTLPLRLRLRNATASSLVVQTQRELMGLLDYEQASLADVQKYSGIKGEVPLFTSLFNYRHNATKTEGDWSSAKGIEVIGGQAWTNYPITVSVDDIGHGFLLTVDSDKRINPRRITSYLHSALQSLVEALRHSADTPVSKLPILPEIERRQVLDAFSGTKTHAPRDRWIHELFESQVRRSPAAVAVVYEGSTLTYDELNRRANQMARYLCQREVQPGDYIAVLMSRGLQMLISQLAILKAGAVYVPIDPDMPTKRQLFIIRDCGARVVLTEGNNGLDCLVGQPASLIDASAASSEIATRSPDNLHLRGSSIAYVMYTSGSTGLPKGVVVSHFAVNRLCVDNGFAEINSTDCVVHCSNPAFDASTFEIWGALMNGARLLVLPQSVVLQGKRFADALELNGVSVLWLSAGLFTQYSETLTDVFSRLRYLLVGGDVVDPKSIRHVLRAGRPAKLINGYGPTECTTFTSTHLIDSVDPDATDVPIGRPIADTQIYILNSDFEPVPIGVPGEICVAGMGVALGYLNRFDLTAERFVPDLFSGMHSGRMFRTGDLGRWREDGAIEFLGRRDSQIKIRGFRIEIGEIEAQLRQHPLVSDVAVVDRETESGDKVLVAYVIPEASHMKKMRSDGSDQANSEAVARWMDLYEETYGAGAAGPSFVGWNSSYTGQPIPENEMLEWLSGTVDRIRSLEPRRVLEIGCGVGLLLQHLAPQCETYVGTDFSSAALEKLRTWISGRDNLRHVELFHRPANELEFFEPNSFDTIVLNSVIQYFPDSDYLVSVLQQAVRLVIPGGHIFIGDIRDLRLLPIFHSAVQLAKASATVNVGQLRKRTARSIAQDKELVVDPRFFLRLNGKLPEILTARASLKHGSFKNELSRYRYDVVLQVGGQARTIAEPESMEWGVDVGSVEELAAMLTAKRPALRLRAVPNRRLSQECAAHRMLEEGQDRLEAGALRTLIKKVELTGVDPEEIRILSRRYGYDVNLSVDVWGRPDHFEALLVDRHGNETRQWIEAAPSKVPVIDLSEFVNDPTESSLRQQIIPQLRSYMGDCLPEYMIPSAWMVLKQLPLTSNGKVDRRALPLPLGRPEDMGEYTAPFTDLERTLADIWAQVLKVDQVGVQDSFFELGGHSLLAIRVLSRINQTFGSSISVTDMYKSPTIRDLIRLLDGSATPDEVISLTKESALDESIAALSGVARVPAEHVMLTGATGFVGRFLLIELLRNTNATVYCLVRSSSVQQAHSRIRAVLTKWDMWDHSFGPRITAIPADLTKSRLGLDDANYQLLCDRIDSIYHCGTSMNHLETYAMAKSANVDGARELLRMATSGRPKSVNYISTLGVFSSREDDVSRRVSESSQIDFEYHRNSRGYVASKWVGEKLFLIASDRGIPCNIFRLGLVWADSEQGRYDELQSGYRMFKSCILSGFGISDYLFESPPTPVDYVARSVVWLANKHRSGQGVFHLSSPAQMASGIFERCNELLEEPLSLVTYFEWIQIVKKLHQDGCSLPAVPLVESSFAVRDRSIIERAQSPFANIQFNCERTYKELEQDGIVAPTFDDQLLKIFLRSLLSRDDDLRKGTRVALSMLPALKEIVRPSHTSIR